MSFLDIWFPFRLLFTGLLLCCSGAARAEEPAVFYRAINLNGPALEIDGHAWEAEDGDGVTVSGGSGAFENPAVPLKPPTGAARTRMIQSSRWGSGVEVKVRGVPEGVLQVFVYVWEDNHSERFDILVNDQPVLEGFNSGGAGSWKKLGPWTAEGARGTLTVSARGGAANLSGIEIWRGPGPVPEPVPLFVTTPTAEQTDFFERKIRPVLADRCYECHSVEAKNIGGGLLLDSRAGILKGGDTGPVMTPGEPEASLLIHAVRHTDPNLQMPAKGDRLKPEEIADLETWIRQGAPDPRVTDTVAAAKAKNSIDWNKAREWWSFRPIQDPPPPPVKNTDWPRNDLDRFILTRLERENLTPSGDAEKATLLRRVTFDLTGLPPSPEEVDAFLKDEAPDAFAKVVERLLASPRYGERWGRHWLDVARYADSAGDNSDFPVPQMYRYRNWVIDAFNNDLPYDQFVRQQLAGDLLPAETREETSRRIIATGYLASARRFGSRVDDYPWHLTIEDTIDNVGRAFLGLTVNCARCHDHKFDPITAADYYALYGIFHSTRYPWPGIELDQRQRDLTPLVPAEEAERALRNQEEERQKLEAEVKRLEEELKTAEGEAKDHLKQTLKKAKGALDEHGKAPPPFDLAYAVAEAKKIEDVPIQLKGDPAKPGATVRRRFLTVLSGTENPPELQGSGRRELSDWIMDPANPLTARVMVNRIWLHHFGKGLVTTPNDFGKQGRAPTHPELLDWLATRFRESGWSVKAMHRLILLSRAWQLDGRRGEEALAADPGNTLLAAFPRRRLDAEALRDTLLLLGGTLDLSPGGEHPFPPQAEWNFTQHHPFKALYETNKRSVYLMTQRIQRDPFLSIFDGADPSASTALRPVTTTPLQALWLLNDPLVHEQAERFAERLCKAEPDDPCVRLTLAWRLALGREPEAAERERATAFLTDTRAKLQESGAPPDRLDAESWQALARAVFRMNEFVYVD